MNQCCHDGTEVVKLSDGGDRGGELMQKGQKLGQSQHRESGKQFLLASPLKKKKRGKTTFQSLSSCFVIAL